MRMTRRRLLLAIGAAMLAAPLPAFAVPPPSRVVVLDWGLTEVVLALGVVPVGVSRPPWYRQLDGDPALPPQVVDTGLLYQPNFEVLQDLRPELILVNAQHAPLLPMLERIAPTLTVDLYAPGRRAYPQVRAQTARLGEVLGRRGEAAALLRRTDALIAASAARLPATVAAQPVLLFKPIDGRHVSVHGPASLFGGVLEALGLRNAWSGATDFQGMAETDLAALAALPAAQAVAFGPPALLQSMQQSPLWQALPFVRQAGLHRIEDIYPLGGPVSAMRFAGRLADALAGVRG